MSLYLPSLTDDELIRHSYQVATTDLEKELVKRYHALYDNAEAIPYVEVFKDAVWGVADNLGNVEGYSRSKASAELFDAVEKFEEAQE